MDHWGICIQQILTAFGQPYKAILLMPNLVHTPDCFIFSYEHIFNSKHVSYTHNTSSCSLKLALFIHWVHVQWWAVEGAIVSQWLPMSHSTGAKMNSSLVSFVTLLLCVSQCFCKIQEQKQSSGQFLNLRIQFDYKSL